MAAISTAFKKNRALGPQNEPVCVYFGTFGPLPLAAGTYHLWDVPPGVRFIDGYVEVDTASGSAQNGILGVMKTDDTTTVDAAENISGSIAAGAAALSRFAATWTRVEVPVPPTGVEKYALVWNREVAVTGNGETITVCMLAIRDDLT